MTPSTQRTRFGYIAAALATIVAGLFVHRSDALAPAARDIGGDALWAMMVAWWVGALVPAKPLPARAAVALAIAWIVELTQLYHAPWIDSLRASRLVHLVLGSDFYARDLLSYAGGVAAAVLLEAAARRRVRQTGTA
jgi:hypothetical protein